jgi:RNA polymerase sigma-70 factor (ECF subfamily)
MSRKEDMTYKQIAAVMEISPKTVENQIGNALKFLKKFLKR